MKYLICPNAYKGTITASQAAMIIASAVGRNDNEAVVDILPIADGGDGTSEIICSFTGGRWVECNIHDALMRPCKAHFIRIGRDTAVINVSAASGIADIEPTKRNPMKTTSFGTGELIAHAIKHGCSKIVLALGGSATCDCGIGIAQALGVRFYNGTELLTDTLTGADMIRITNIERPKKPLRGIKFTLLCDADAHCYGPHGAAHLFAPQKGADAEMVKQLDEGLEHIYTIIAGKRADKYRQMPFLGAAGAISTMMFFRFGAAVMEGTEWMLRQLRFSERVADADIVITGEGAIDEQSLEGKALGGVLSRAKQQGKQVYAICGTNNLKRDVNGLTIVEMRDKTLTLEENMTLNQTKINLQNATAQIQALAQNYHCTKN